MGPDCGTAIVSGVPLGFANEVRAGDIGLIGASGTGLQQVSSLIDGWGAGLPDYTPAKVEAITGVQAKRIERLAAAYRSGRLLLILTTNLDQGRPVIWNCAESREPSAACRHCRTAR